MERLLLLLLVILGITSIGGSSSSEVEIEEIETTSSNDINICSGAANNLFVPHISNCSEYYLCMNGLAISRACPRNYYFDAREQSCLGKESAQCLPTCPPQALTSFSYDRTCNKYILCYAGTPVLRVCSDGLQYNAETDRCDFPQYVDCVDNLCTVFNNPNDITFIASHAKCNKYYICVDGIPENQTCAAGLQYNPDCKCCDFPSRANCTVEILQRNIKPLSKAPPRSADIVCPSTGSHFFAHRTRSDSYYYCVDGHGITLDCTPGLVYDEKRAECREPHLVGTS